MIKTVIFDLGGVIVPFDFKRGYQAMADRYGLVATEIPGRIGTTDVVIRYESGQIETPDFVRELTGSLGIEATVDEFADFWSVIFERRTLIPASLPEALRANGYRVLLLSNTNDLHFSFIRQHYPILDHFDHHVLSFRVGAMKPSPAIYAEAIRHAGCAPEECFFTDDVAMYVEGAKAAGIDAVQFKQYEQLREELLVRGVRI